eukprot:g47821.t1
MVSGDWHCRRKDPKTPVRDLEGTPVRVATWCLRTSCGFQQRGVHLREGEHVRNWCGKTTSMKADSKITWPRIVQTIALSLANLNTLPFTDLKK